MLAEINQMIQEFGSAPKLEEMPRRSLSDKGIDGPTSAHVIEEVHTPLNLAYLTCTTGSSAFQNIVGVTYAEMPRRIKAAFTVLEMAGIRAGDELLITYPPLVNVFSGAALQKYGIKWSFLVRSSRDAFLAALYDKRPKAVLGESSFIRASLEDAKHIGVDDELPNNLIVLTAGTPLDLELLPVAEEVLKAKVHDLYGCQEYGWLTFDGIPVRGDIQLIKLPTNKIKDMYELVVGGLPTGDSFPIVENGHVCNRDGKIITYRRQRSYPEHDVLIRASTLSSKVTLERVARSILRIKGRVVRVAPDVIMRADHTVLELIPPGFCPAGKVKETIIEGPENTQFFDDMIQAQLDYQQNGKADPVWKK